MKFPEAEELDEPSFELASNPIFGFIKAGSKRIPFVYDEVNQPERKKEIENLRQKVRYYRLMTYIEILH
jgi:hypothetical protein